MRPYSPLALAAAVLTAILIAPLTASAVTIDFSTLGGLNGDPFTTYSQTGYTVATTSGAFSVGKLFGDPVPDIYSALGTVTVSRTSGNGKFFFDGVDLANAQKFPEDYIITGFFNATQAFKVSGLITGNTVFNTYATTFSTDVLTSLTISLGSVTSTDANIDNIRVEGVGTAAATPEPSSLMLFGTGLAGLAGMVRRRITA